MIKKSRTVVLAAMATLAVCFNPTPSKAASCADYQHDMTRAELAADVTRAQVILDELERNNACNAVDGAMKLMEWSVARIHFNMLQRQGQLATQETALRAALKIGHPWQLETALADILYARKKYDEAAQRYQAALDDIRDEELTKIAPGAEVIALVYQKAEQSRQLAKDYVEAKDSRGEPGGLAYANVRGFTAVKTAIPIEFETAKTDFTPKGQKAANDMIDYLRRANFPKIKLTGHTDERGEDAYNLELSHQRALKLKEYLEANAYPKGRIELSWLGETQAYQAADASTLTQEEIWQLNRRVELERK